MQPTGICGGEIGPDNKVGRAACPGRLIAVVRRQNVMTLDSESLLSKLSDVGLPSVTVIRQNIALLFGNAKAERLDHPGNETVFEYSLDGKSLGYAEFYPSGILKSVKPWSNGRPHGVWQEFGESGHLLSHTNYVDGEKSGVMLRWHDNESLAFASECQGNVEIGTTVTWSSDGQIETWRRREANRNRTAFICSVCRHSTYWEGWDHAGFSERGFLYNEDGDFVISWDARDPSYVAIVGQDVWPWALNEIQRQTIEDRLMPAPHGGRYLFSNPGRCANCRAPIAYPLPRCVYLWDRKRMIRSGQGEDFPDGPLINYLTRSNSDDEPGVAPKPRSRAD